MTCDTLTAESATAYALDLFVEPITVISATPFNDHGAPAIDVVFDMDGRRDVLTVWIEADGFLYGEW